MLLPRPEKDAAECPAVLSPQAQPPKPVTTTDPETKRFSAGHPHTPGEARPGAADAHPAALRDATRPQQVVGLPVSPLPGYPRVPAPLTGRREPRSSPGPAPGSAAAQPGPAPPAARRGLWSAPGPEPVPEPREPVTGGSPLRKANPCPSPPLCGWEPRRQRQEEKTGLCAPALLLL